MRSLRWSILTFAALLASACFILRGVQIADVAVNEAAAVASRARAHLLDGSTVIYEKGFIVRNRMLQGYGTRYDLGAAVPRPVERISLDSVVAVESYQGHTDLGGSVIISALTTVAAIGISVAIVAATCTKCFGSCPTFYSDSAGTPVLEAEGFSYSIAPLFEARDVDRLRARADSAGVVRLEVRDEALETHFLNHLELLEVRHAWDERALPDPGGLPLVVRNSTPLRAARDRAGRAVLPALAAHDGIVYRTDSTVLRAANAEDVSDHIDIELAPPQGADSLVVILRLRNSLLNTVLFYDLMIGDRGARSVDWLAHDLESLGHAAELGRWAKQEMGLRVNVPEGAGWREVARISETGPVAWKDVAVLVPSEGRGTQRIRLSFIADDWRIDQVASAAQWRRATPRTVPLARVTGMTGREEAAALTSLGRADDHYLRTSAGERFFAEFAAGPLAGPDTRTFFLASQGYYLEWIRRAWLERPTVSAGFTPGRPALAEAIRRWRVSQDSTERLFYATKVPVR